MNDTVSFREPAVPVAWSIERPTGGLLALNGGGTTVTLGSTATRVTRTAVPFSVNTHIGTSAGPIDVSMRLVARFASVTTRGLQSVQPDESLPAATRSASA